MRNSTATLQISNDRPSGVYTVDDSWDAIERLYDQMDRDAEKVTDPISLDRILEIEPGAASLMHMAQRYCGTCHFYSGMGFKRSVMRYVGDLARRTELRSPQAYDVLYHAVYDAMLSNCHRCTPQDENDWEVCE